MTVLHPSWGQSGQAIKKLKKHNYVKNKNNFFIKHIKIV